MPRNDTKATNREIRAMNKTNRNISGNINALLDQLSTAAFGSSTNRDVETLNNAFNSIIRGESDAFNRNGGSDTQSFISSLFKDSTDRMNPDNNIISQMNNIFDDSTNESAIQSFIGEAYKNRMLKQADLHEIASQLIELREAVLITRDAIISSDIVEGKMTRNLHFDDVGENRDETYKPMVETMEKKFNLQNKIKNFIIPKALEFGEYYAYCIPFSKIFSDFMQRKEKSKFGYSNLYHATTLFEFVEEHEKSAFVNDVNHIFESTYEYTESSPDIISRTDINKENKSMKEAFDSYITNMMKNVTVCNDPLPLNILEEGAGSTNYFMETAIDLNTFNEKKEDQVGDIGSDSFFNRVIKSDHGDGMYSANSRKNTQNKEYTEKDFADIHDCYIKMIDPMHLIPVQIMNRRIGYYYIQSEEVSPVTGVVASSLYYNRFEDKKGESTIVDSIAQRIVQCFDKKFLLDNAKFKDLIVEALSYYNLNSQKVRFQFIPAEYIVAFKVNEDENGYGTSMLDGSLFYAKLYLMLLLFKMMSIILYSNDTRVNYVKNSGIDRNVRKKIEDIARTKQQRSITVMDMFSYTSLVNKLGVGAEVYIPTGKSGERGIETEVIQGQDVQMNTDLMDNLKKSYILASGVPDAIMNYMNEADFAKSLELANTRFQGRVVSYQYDFNEGITEMYKRLMKWSTNIEPEVIDTFEFSFAPPKASSGQIKADLLQNFDSYSQFIVNMFLGQANADNPENEPIVRELKKLLAKDYLPMINFDKLKDAFKMSKIRGLAELLTPKGEEDDSMDQDLANI